MMFRCFKTFRMLQAVSAVVAGMSIRLAASKYQIPNSTLQRHVNNPEIRSVGGTAPILSVEEEREILDWIIESANRGAPKSSLDVLEGANKIYRRRQGDQAQTLGKGWLQKFNKRQKLVYRVADNLGKASANLTRPNIEGWFAQVSAYLIEKPELVEAMADRRRVLNADETMMRLNSSAARFLAPKGKKKLFQVTKDDKAGLTVMATFDADGNARKPFIIYPYERIPKNLDSSFPHNKARLAATKSGWMISDTFCNFLDFLAQEVADDGIEFPIVLFVDNHASHTTIEASETAKRLQIILIFLYPNSTFILQPADVAIFRCLKSLWREENRIGKQKEIVITKLNFAELFLHAFDQISPTVIKNGFFRSGLFPFDSSNVDYTKCIGEESSSSLDLHGISTGSNDGNSGSDEEIYDESSNNNPQFFSAAASTSCENAETNVEDGWSHGIIESRYDESTMYDVQTYHGVAEELEGNIDESSHTSLQVEICENYETMIYGVDEEEYGIEYHLDESMEETGSSFSCEPTLKLPSKSKREGKRQVKRTHPVAQGNISNMLNARELKRQKTEDLQARKLARAQKKKEAMALKLENAKKRQKKNEKLIENLTQQQKKI
jgi:DDE superfamily endonuclease/helix-turn-helix, Psq domain/Tc5 transposase DNA-binding domain